jgi:site-specific recombinase XerC
MTALTPTIQAFLIDRLAAQRDASPATIAAYRDALRLLLIFANERTGSPRPVSTLPTSTPPL